MAPNRRTFIKGGVAAFTVSFAAPAFLSDIARAQGARSRNLVVLYLSGGNDALSMVVPYGNPGYYQRRPSIAVPQGNVLQVGADTGGTNIGLHPRLQGMKRIFDDGRLAVIQRSGYPNSSRSHFQGTDIWSTADPSNPSGPGWLGRYLELMPQPVDPLTGWNTVRETPRTLLSRFVGVPAIPDPRTYAFSSPNTGNEALFARQAATRIASHVPVDRPHLSFVSATSRAAFETLDRVASVAAYTPTVTYPTTGLGSALRAVAGAMVRSIGTKVFWVQTGGFDTHASQDPNNVNGAYYRLMATMDDALLAFYTDLRNHGLLNDSLVLQFSEFGRRVYENGSQGTDHGAASSMMVMGGGVNGGLYGTAPDLRDTPGNPTLESNNGDVRFQTDFRSVYARVLDQWLGAPSTTILEGDFRQPGLTFL
ncbi:DUF1501 domain-containing protein, partial [Luteitalea sp.]|jgi:uncharacterized protein (DUF1501 family)|uniref:DUF1501 domain-containing protein n=1 Tax=Luteitalea sp. TaxID=2004800 RepID=UPI0037C72A4A